MDQLTIETIDYLIHCPKKVVDPPRKEMVLTDGHWRNSMKLQSEDGANDFSAFLRKNEDFEEDFSIGLAYLPREVRGDIILLRCNGPHGPHVLFDHHTAYHVHMADPGNISLGLKAERFAQITSEYASFDDALGYFLRKCNIVEADKYFPDAIQRHLFSGRTQEQ
jgi:hypothetical protein